MNKLLIVLAPPLWTGALLSIVCDPGVNRTSQPTSTAPASPRLSPGWETAGRITSAGRRSSSQPSITVSRRRWSSRGLSPPSRPRRSAIGCCPGGRIPRQVRSKNGQTTDVG
jgi:hypothetical protein